MGKIKKKGVRLYFYRFLAALTIVVLLFLSGGGASGAEVSPASLFQRRSWAAMDAFYSAGRPLSPMDHSLMANALRIQNRWAEAVEILERHADSFPAEVKPYAEMTLLLGYENLKRIPEALKTAARLEKTAPADLRYYVA
ncbi:MAG: hypothetical protein LBQ90_03130, partial [Synergistaceae bacterium]|nr:hypothetical protein [Synergistaceae bacterium]